MRWTTLAVAPVSVIALAFLWNPDQLAILTMWPAWTYQVVSLPLVFLGWRKATRRSKQVRWLVVAFAVLAVNPEPAWLLRSFVPTGPSDLRVVTLNCAGGILEAAAEVSAFDPDLVLLQESPGKDDLKRLMMDLYGDEGSFVNGPDGSIVARGALERVQQPIGTSDHTSAIWTLNGKRIRVVSLRLTPPVFRLDFWNPEAWSQVANNRRIRRHQLAEISSNLVEPKDQPLIVAGDFNCAGHDPVLREMPSRLTDAFRWAGRGWGHTGLNDFPLIRVDQIWASAHFAPVNAFAVKTVNSDHRMVIADFTIVRPSQ